MQRRTGGTSRKSDWSSRSFSIFGWLGVCLCKSQTRWSLLRGFPSGRVGDWKYCRQFEDVKLRGYHISMMDVYFFFVYKSKCWKIRIYHVHLQVLGCQNFPNEKSQLGWSRFPHPRFIPPCLGCSPGTAPQKSRSPFERRNEGKIPGKNHHFFLGTWRITPLIVRG